MRKVTGQLVVGSFDCYQTQYTRGDRNLIPKHIAGPSQGNNSRSRRNWGDRLQFVGIVRVVLLSVNFSLARQLAIAFIVPWIAAGQDGANGSQLRIRLQGLAA